MTSEPESRPGGPGWWLLTLLLAGGVFLMSSVGATPLPMPHPLDWLAHFLTYLALGYCLGRAIGNWTLAWVVVAWFGALDELHQAFVPPREAGIVDWWFDLAGSALGAWLAAGKERRSPDSALPVLDVHFGDGSAGADGGKEEHG